MDFPLSTYLQEKNKTIRAENSKAYWIIKWLSLSQEYQLEKQKSSLHKLRYRVFITETNAKSRNWRVINLPACCSGTKGETRTRSNWFWSSTGGYEATFAHSLFDDQDALLTRMQPGGTSRGLVPESLAIWNILLFQSSIQGISRSGEDHSIGLSEGLGLGVTMNSVVSMSKTHGSDVASAVDQTDDSWLTEEDLTTT